MNKSDKYALNRVGIPTLFTLKSYILYMINKFRNTLDKNKYK